jgi:hypothetical protein
MAESPSIERFRDSLWKKVARFCTSGVGFADSQLMRGAPAFGEPILFLFPEHPEKI